MKVYWRIFTYTQSYGRLIASYLLVTSLAVIFGTLNFTLLSPLFQILFQDIDNSAISNLHEPVFAFRAQYLIDLFNYYFAKTIVDYGKISALRFVCVVIGFSVLFSNIFRFLGQRLINASRSIGMQNLRNDVFRKITSLHLGYFSNAQKGDLMARLTTDMQEIENSILGALQWIIKDPVTILVYFVVLFYTSFELTIFTILFLPLSGGIIAEVTKRLRKAGGQTQALLGNLLGIIDETLHGLKVIYAFNAQNYIQNKFLQTSQFYSETHQKLENKREMASPLSEFLGVLTVTVILLYGGTLVLEGTSDLKAADFITYIIIFSQILSPAKAISAGMSNIQRSLASAERLITILDTPSNITSIPNAVKLEKLEKEIVFRNVGFAYQERKVLQNINFTIPKGKTVALVGASGGGKSTLADLLARFYDVTEGEILIDGTNVKNIELGHLRQLLGIVTQESILFNDTISNNIAFGINAMQGQVERAAKIANAHDFILQTENAYQSNIGDRGMKLSGGQRQRLAIARAVLKNPDILILDEATSALDSESEKLVQDALYRLLENRTSLVIAHRLSTIQHADLILVMQEGEIVERGTHQELMDKNGIYRKLQDMQKTANKE